MIHHVASSQVPCCQAQPQRTITDDLNTDMATHPPDKMSLSKRPLQVPLGADLSHIIHETTFVNTHYGPLILPVSSFLPPLPLPPLSGAISPLKCQDHIGVLTAPKIRTLETQANWERLRDRDTIVSWDGKRTVRPLKKQKGTKSSDFKFVKKSKKDMDPASFQYELVVYATKHIVRFPTLSIPSLAEGRSSD